MLPLSLLRASQGHEILVELKNGDTYNGTLVNCDNFMNINLTKVIFTSHDASTFLEIPTCYIRGYTIKYLRIEDSIIDKVPEDGGRGKKYAPGRGRGRGRGGKGGRGGHSKGRGRGRS